MARLTAHRDGSFDLLFHPVSNVFAEDVRPVWAECGGGAVSPKLPWWALLNHPVTFGESDPPPGGVLLAGFMNPLFFLFDHDAARAGAPLVVQYPLPYSDPANPDPAARERWRQSGLAAEFSDSLAAQLAASFLLTALYDDGWSDDITPLNRYTPMYLATRAIKQPDSRFHARMFALPYSVDIRSGCIGMSPILS